MKAQDAIYKLLSADFKINISGDDKITLSSPIVTSNSDQNVTCPVCNFDLKRLEAEIVKILKNPTALDISQENQNILEESVLTLGAFERQQNWQSFNKLLQAFEAVEHAETAQLQQNFDLALANLRTIYTNLTRLKLG